MSNIKFKSGEDAAREDRTVFRAYEEMQITAAEGARRINKNNALERQIDAVEFVNVARELGYFREQRGIFYEQE